MQPSIETILSQRLYQFLVDQSPDLLVRLQAERRVTTYIQEKVLSVASLWAALQQEQQHAYAIEAQCMQALTEDLRPSRYWYLSDILEEDFAETSDAWRDSGVRTYEIMNLLQLCQSAFLEYGFTQTTRDNRFLRYEIIGRIVTYLEPAVKEN